MPIRLLLLALWAVPSLSGAAPITFSYTGTVDVDVDGTLVQDESYTINAFADTDDVINPGPSARYLVQVEFIGSTLGTVAFDNSWTFQRSTNVSGVSLIEPNASGGRLVQLRDGFGGWDAQSSIGPISAFSLVLLGDLADTSQGTPYTLLFETADVAPDSFQASVPEPRAIFLLLMTLPLVPARLVYRKRDLSR